MSASPVFFVTPRTAAAACNASAQTIKLTGTANNTTSIIVGGATGSMITRVHLANNGSSGPTTANSARFFLLNSANYYLVAEVAITAFTPSASVIGFHADIPELVGMVLPDANWSLVFGMGVAGVDPNIYVATAFVLDA